MISRQLAKDASAAAHLEPMGTTMAKQPSMTPAEAENLLGPRGHLSVTADNRALVRKWLIAISGMPALFVAGLSYRELQLAYNGIDGAAIETLKKKLAQLPQDDLPETPQAEPQAQAVIEQPAPQAPQGDLAAVLRELILKGYTPGLDENRVRSIVQEQIAGIAPRVIEIRQNDKPAVRIEGLVHPQFELIVNLLSTKGPNGYQANVMLVGPAGCGKTHLITQVAKAFQASCSIVACTAGTTEGDMLGRLLPGAGGAFEYVASEPIKLYEAGNAVIGFDESDNLDPNMAAIMNMPLANSHWHCHLRRDNPAVQRGENVYFIGTANTFGTGNNPLYVARNQQDEASRDRWIYITVDYDKRLEESIAASGGLTAAEMAGIWELRDKCREAQLRRVISTRAFQKASVMKLAGQSWREIRDRLLEGWSKDERAKVGV